MARRRQRVQGLEVESVAPGDATYLRTRPLFVGARRWRFAYPSGKRGTLTGTLYQGDETLAYAVLVVDDHTIIALDPRAIVEEIDGAAAYHPRRLPLNDVAPWVILWLAEHPEWDPLPTLGGPGPEEP